MRTRVYIDGFNLYYGALKGSRFRWLSPVELVRRLLPATCAIDKVKYFTARVSGAADPTAPRRQQIYLSALKALPEVELHFGRFLAKTVWRPVINLPVAGAVIRAPSPTSLPAGQHAGEGGSLATPRQLVVGSYPVKGTARTRPSGVPHPVADALIVEVHAMEEKGSDVNLAAHLLNDAWSDLFDVAAVISNDTDLVTPIRMVSVDRGKPVYVVCPGRWQIAPALAQVATYVRHIHAATLSAAQLPDPIPGTTIRKPPHW